MFCLQNRLISGLLGIFSVYSGDKAICQIILKGELPMNLYEAVKGTVKPRMAAEHYGLKVKHSGMTCCPFHNDRNPSLKLNEDYYYCFGCGAHGDVIDLTAKLLGVGNYEAAKRLVTDFGISNSDGSNVMKRVPKHPLLKEYQRMYKLCFGALTDYLHLLEEWKQKYAPESLEADMDERFVEACMAINTVEYLVDLLMYSSRDEQADMVTNLIADGTIERVVSRLLKASKEEAADGAEPAGN